MKWERFLIIKMFISLVSMPKKFRDLLEMNIIMDMMMKKVTIRLS